ncbi:MAG: O-antigen ligase family protein [Oscillospiraceae bacterium]|nr:O-antigen ligase family protein [Oscillospiraceae bacterium]
MKAGIQNRISRGAFRNHWLILLIAVQPVLDIVAFWTRSPSGTLAGVVRLAVMVALPLVLLFTLPEKKDRRDLALCLCAIGLVCALHLANVLRLGAESLVYEISYTAKTAHMPVLAVCFLYAIRDTQTRNQAYWGLSLAAAVTALALLLSIVTGTANVTYGNGLGVSGWVIDDLRTANSTILVVLAAFATFCAVKSDKKLVNILVPALTAVCLILNGTMTCYLSIFLIFLGFSVFLPLEKKIRGCRINKTAIAVLLAAAVLSAAAYPLTPKYKIRQQQTSFMDKTQTEFEQSLDDAALDLSTLTREQILSDPEIHQLYEDYYWKCLWILSPGMFEIYDIDEIMAKYDFTIDTTILLNTRILKRNFVSLMWDHSDTLTKLFGIDCSAAWLLGGVDLENDWPAIFYYYGYVGFAAYAAFILYFVFLILRRLRRNFRTAFTADNFVILMCFVLLIGIAQYSGAVLRRPNVSFYLALILGLIYFQTEGCPADRVNSWRGEWI